jgi:hypothetical protein
VICNVTLSGGEKRRLSPLLIEIVCDAIQIEARPNFLQRMVINFKRVVIFLAHLGASINLATPRRRPIKRRVCLLVQRTGGE